MLPRPLRRRSRFLGPADLLRLCRPPPALPAPSRLTVTLKGELPRVNHVEFGGIKLNCPQSGFHTEKPLVPSHEAAARAEERAVEKEWKCWQEEKRPKLPLMVGSSLPAVLSSSAAVLLFRGCGSGSGTVWFPEIKKNMAQTLFIHGLQGLTLNQK